jgi:hypothetical protein
VGRGEKERVTGMVVNIKEMHYALCVCMCVCVCVCVRKYHNETHQTLLNGRWKEKGWLRKSNIDAMNLIKVYYMHFVNITMKSQ